MPKTHIINSDTLKSWLDNEQAVLIDVREPAEYAAENIQGAINQPLSTVTIDTAHMPEHKGKKLVLHCQAGKRSAMACEKLIRENPDFDIWDLEGGIQAWKSAGLETNNNKKLLPLDRQIQITVSIIILIGLILSTFNPVGNILILIAGLGLGFAGITGHCMMMKLLAKIPWNKS